MFGLMRIKIHEDELERLGKSFVQENTALREESSQEKGALQEKLEAQAVELKAALALNKLLCAEKDEWKRQNTALQEQYDEITARYAGAVEDYSRAAGEKAILQEQLQDVEKSRHAQHDLVLLQQRHNEVVEEYAALQEQVAHSFPSEEQQKIYEQMRLSYSGTAKRLFKVQKQYGTAMALLAELYEARVKKGSVKFWDTRYLDLQAQYDKLAPVEAEEAKEE